MSRQAFIAAQRRLFDDVFKIDELLVEHQRPDGAMSTAQRRLVFERGDSVAVLLVNSERRAVILVEQFRAPALQARRRDDASSTDGWMIETVAGMIDADEPPEAAAIRETFEETGYRVGKLELIARFFASPGGTSERVFLYFAEVADTDRSGAGGGVDDEDVSVTQIGLDTLFERLAAGSIEDPKLLIAAYWLQSRTISPA